MKITNIFNSSIGCQEFWNGGSYTWKGEIKTDITYNYYAYTKSELVCKATKNQVRIFFRRIKLGIFELYRKSIRFSHQWETLYPNKEFRIKTRIFRIGNWFSVITNLRVNLIIDLKKVK